MVWLRRISNLRVRAAGYNLLFHQCLSFPDREFTMSSITCPQCSYPNPEDHLFCQKCGSRLTGTDEQDTFEPDESPHETEEQFAAELEYSDSSEFEPDPTQSTMPAEPAAAEPAPSRGIRLWMIILAGAGLMVCGFLAIIVVLAVIGLSDVSGDDNSGEHAIEVADFQRFLPDPSAGEVTVSGETVSSDTGTVSVVIPEDSDWDVVTTQGGFVSLEHTFGFLDIGVFRSDFPTTPDELMDEEVEWMLEEYSDSEVILGPEYFEFENGAGVMFVMAYDMELIILDFPELDVYSLSVDDTGTVVLWINFYGLESEWDDFSGDVEQVVATIRSPLFE
jgi:hypothetical protein